MKDTSKKTTTQPFGKYEDTELFSVNAGVAVEDALEVAGNLMMYVESLAAADAIPDKVQEAAIIQHLSEMAKALTRACGGRGSESNA